MPQKIQILKTRVFIKSRDARLWILFFCDRGAVFLSQENLFMNDDFNREKNREALLFG